jgi:hypothetical protein
MNRSVLVVGALAVVVVALGGWWVWGEPAVRQPIEFPHRVHLELDDSRLECKSCHEGVETRLAAGVPATSQCLSCHSGETESAELRKLQAYGDDDREVPWRRVWRLSSDVFFSHRTHVAMAAIECQTCHGPMETLDQPPARALKKLTMSDCIACHERWQWPDETAGSARQPVRLAATPVSVDCNACHR